MYNDAKKRYQLLLNVNNAIIDKSNRETLFEALAHEIRKLFHNDRFSINLYDPKTNKLSFFSTADGVIPQELDKRERPLDHGAISKHVINTKQCLIIRNLAHYQYWPSAKAMYDAGLKATIACPLLIRGKVLGSMNISYREQPSDIESLAQFFEELSGQVSLAVDNMLAHTQMQNINENLKKQKNYLLQEVDNHYDPDHFFFTSPQMWDLISQLEIFAETDASILITGETGTGKDYIARCIHNLSHRRNSMFVKISCPSLSPSLFESELFGHSKGAFTGAHSQKIGRLEMANGGTLFLDEIGELSPALQAKLLQVLQEQTFERVGDSNSITVDFRIIAATNKDLHESINKNQFRSDLFYRLDTLPLHIPALRERPEDIPFLLQKLTETESLKMNKQPPIYSSSVINTLAEYPWPGNVRELKNLVKRLIILKANQRVYLEDVQNILCMHTSDQQEDALTNEPLSLHEMEKKHIEKVLHITNGRIGGQEGAAYLLDIPRTTLQYRIRKHGINLNDFRR